MTCFDAVPVGVARPMMGGSGQFDGRTCFWDRGAK